MIRALFIFLLTGWRDVKFFGISTSLIRVRLNHNGNVIETTGLYLSVFDRVQYMVNGRVCYSKSIFNKKTKFKTQAIKNNCGNRSFGFIDEAQVISWKKIK